MTVTQGDSLAAAARDAGEALEAAGLVAVTAESCTGGWIAKALTDVAGSSAWFDRAFITYSNDAKTDMLGVPPATLDAHGAVSEAVVRAMAAGALERSGAGAAVAVSGIAGPGGGSADKPVGTVWFAWAARGAVDARRELFKGDREAVRRQAVVVALDGLKRVAQAPNS
ncbi:MAG: nicotinamide-nucleotide amidohydrolase family protein [Pseudomonadota bacterium]